MSRGVSHGSKHCQWGTGRSRCRKLARWTHNGLTHFCNAHIKLVPADHVHNYTPFQQENSEIARLSVELDILKSELAASRSELNQLNNELASVYAKNEVFRKLVYSVICDASRAEAGIIAVEHGEALTVQVLNPVLFAIQSILKAAKGA